MEVGAVVRVRGLTSSGSDKLNGQLGMIVSLHASAKKEGEAGAKQEEASEATTTPSEARWVVRIMGGETEQSVAIRGSHLRIGRTGSPTLRTVMFGATGASVAVAGVAIATGPGHLVCGLAPACSLFWLISTVSTCYWLHQPLLAEGVFVPAISEMAISKVARLVYRLGFGLCGLQLAVTVLLFNQLVKPHAGSSRDVPSSTTSDISSTDLGTIVPHAWPGIGYGFMSAAGVALQGICTLRVDANWETGVHLMASMAAMWGAMQHGAQSNAWYSALPTDSPLLLDGVGGWGLWMRRDAMQQAVASGGGLFLLFLVPLGLQLASRLGMGGGGHTMENGMGLMQWTIVAGIALFFCSYTFDLVLARCA